MRAQFDPEYLGIVPPGLNKDVGESAVIEVEEDLARIGAAPSLRRDFRRLAAERRRQLEDFCQWLERLPDCPDGPESLRAMAIAYTLDHRGVRRRLEAVALLEGAFAGATTEPRPTARASIGSLWSGLRMRRRFDRLFKQPGFRDFDQKQRSACCRWITRRRGPLLAALRRLTDGNDSANDPIADAARLLADVGRDPATWTRQLVTLRAVQTLSVLDLDAYCQLVAELGDYKVS